MTFMGKSAQGAQYTSTPGTGSDPKRWLDEHGDFLYRYALMRVRKPEVAEDVVQETFWLLCAAMEPSVANLPSARGCAAS